VPVSASNRTGESDWQVINKIDARFRFSMLTAPAGTMVSINGGAPIAPQWDGTTAYVETAALDQVKFLIPWSTLDGGKYTYVTRIDPVGEVPTYGTGSNYGGQSDPGALLDCSTTTLNVYPGTKEGTVLPNNNCMSTTVSKFVGDGSFVKKILGLGTFTLGDGTVINDARRASPGRDIEYTVSLTMGDSSGTRSPAVCDVWDPKQQRLTKAASDWTVAMTGSKTSTVFSAALPTAQVYYTTKDLRPAGAPNASTDVPNCGNPSDTSTWSTTPPADITTVSGIMVVVPGSAPLAAGSVDIRLPFATGLASNFSTLVTPNVRDYMGYTPNTTTDLTNWGGYSAALTVLKASLWPEVSYEVNTALPIGQVTYTTQLRLNRSIYGAAPADATYFARVYLDNCMLNPQIDTAQFPDLISWKYVDNGQDPTKCGTSSNSYYLLEFPVNNRGWTSGINITWTTPENSAPGDEYVMYVDHVVGKGGDQYAPASFDRKYTKTYTVAPSSVIGASKTTQNPSVRVDTQFSDTVGWFNYSDQSVGRTQFIDVLPYNGDANGSKFSGTAPLSKIEYVGKQAQASTYEYTKAAPDTVNSDPAAASNTDGTTIWCAALSGGDCPSSLAEVTALRFTTPNFDKGMNQYYRLTFAPTGNQQDDVYINALSKGRSADLLQAVPAPAPVKTVVWDTVISGHVYEDQDRDATKDDGEPLIPSYQVDLLDKDGEVVATTTTNADGYYEFRRLVPGDYQTRITLVDPYSDITQSWTNQDAASGQSGTITLGERGVVKNVDFGLAATVTITLNKVADQCADGDVCPLTGAAFDLYRNTAAEGEDPVWERVGAFTPNADDTSVFTYADLRPGTYAAKETQAPEGHNLLAQDIVFTINGDGVTLADGTTAATVIGEDNLTIQVSDTEKVLALPLTGGQGQNMAMWLTVAGLLGAFGLILLARRKATERRA